MPNVTCRIPRSLEIALDRYIKHMKQSASAVVTEALSQFLNHPLHTLFQVSTSGALVKGVYQRAVSVEVLKQHGDFGLGTFDDLDGEMAVLEGRVYQARADGTVREVPDITTAPFAVITRFEPDARGQIPCVENLSELVAQCDQYRKSDNLFWAIRIDGHFDYVHTRAVRAATYFDQSSTARPGTRPKSERLPVTTVAPSSRPIAAIHKSFLLTFSLRALSWRYS